MAAIEEDDGPKRKSPHDRAGIFRCFSVEELRERVTLLQDEKSSGLKP